MARASQRHKFKNIDNTGFGPNSSTEGARLVNKDGSVNLRKSGLPFYERISIYHSLLRMSRPKFFGTIFLLYTSINILFAFVYLVIGVDKLEGTSGAQTIVEKYLQAFFFSSQTLTTVGYGHVSPIGFWANAIASIESLVGILVFALVTGIFYGRFSRPKAYIRFSENIIIAPYKDGRGLMFRLATFKNNHLSDVEATVTAAIHQPGEDGKTVTRFYQLPLEISKINSLALSWTLVHPLDENSPMFLFSERDFHENKVELVVTVKAFDDHFSNTVQQRTSYTTKELVYGAKFIPMFTRAATGDHTILQLDKVNAYERIKLHEEEAEAADSETLAANV
ncbi:ion channel [Chitinophagaceae bacterium MMS25-I14]